MPNEPTALHPGALLLAQSAECAVWQFRNESGDDTMTVYSVFPGVALNYNDFHMTYFDSGFVSEGELLAVDHCREGRMEYAANENAVAYMSAGDMKLDRRLRHTGRFVFPTGHYHGLTVGLDLALARKNFRNELKDFQVEPDLIVEKFALGDYPRVFHNAKMMERIFAEMYQVPQTICLPYFRTKVLEMLLYLQAMEIPADEKARPYFYRAQVEKVRAIQAFLAEHLTQDISQETLSRKFDFPLTSMKKCFQSVCGASIGAWVNTCRMNRAAEMLIGERDRDIADIGCSVGYDSASKFAAAFRKTMGMTPSEYRMERGGKE